MIAGIDIATTNLKVVLVDEGGRPLWRAAVPSPRVSADGAVATDASALLRVLEDLVVGRHAFDVKTGRSALAA